jgi:hypothetical protein
MREDKLYPVEVPACAKFEDMVTVTSNVTGFPCLMKTDTRFPLHTDDRIEFKSEQDVNLEAMKLAELRAGDEIKIQQRANAIQWTMADVPPAWRPVTLCHKRKRSNAQHPNQFLNGVRKFRFISRIPVGPSDPPRRDGSTHSGMGTDGIRLHHRRLVFRCALPTRLVTTRRVGEASKLQAPPDRTELQR